jgi:hypothetical protein
MNSPHIQIGSRWFITFLATALLGLIGSCQKTTTSTPEEDPDPDADPPSTENLPALYRDVTESSGIHFTYRNGEFGPVGKEASHFSILETLGGGVALIDYDGDGLLDIFLPGGGYFTGPDAKLIKGHPCRLYKNLGNGRFRDVTREAGLGQPLFYSHGAAVGDYDCDGWPDLLVTGYGRVALYHNEPVDPSDPRKGRRFREVTREVGLLDGGHFWSTSAAFADFDGDGYPDLYVCQYVNWSFANNPRCGGYHSNIVRDVCPPRQFESVSHALYHNIRGKDGKHRFVDVSREAGLRVPVRKDKDYGKGLGVLAVDVNGDGKPDIYVANDTTDNFLYINHSRPGEMRFTEVGMAMGVARDGGGTPNGSMGVDAGDESGTGLPSIWVTNYEGELHALYRNVMTAEQHFFGPVWRQNFQYSTEVAGIAAIGQEYVGFGTGFLDVDNDGWEDLVVINGHVIRYPVRSKRRQLPVLLRNQGAGKFVSITTQGGTYFRADHIGRGLAIGDLDNRGRPDLVVNHVNDPVAVLRHVGSDKNHWLGLQLVGKANHDVVGARLTLEQDDRRLTRFAKGGGSYLSSGDRRILFGLGQATRAGRLTVEWPSGKPRKQQLEDLAIDHYHRVEQGKKPSMLTRSSN